ncbi:MAG: VanW family protein [Clostridium sp.]|uniref:VanW family protein n=1 Tax=Clostridium sp. TaxID=1506 RepID=UPI00305F4E44
MRKGRKQKRRKTDNKNVIMLIVLLVITFIIVYTITYYGYMKRVVQAYDGIIYPEVYIEDIYVGGKGKKEALGAIVERSNEIMNNDINIKVKDKDYNIYYKDLQIENNSEEVINEAVNYGKNLSLISQYKLIKNPVEKNLQVKYTYNPETVNLVLEDIDKTLSKESENATLTKVNGKLMVSGGKFKEEIDKAELLGLVEATIRDNTENNKGNVMLELPVKTTEPSIKPDDLSRINTIIASYSTNFNEDSRAENIKRAAEVASGVLLMVGDEYSFNKLVGDTTEEKGYGEAPVIIGNEIKSEVGGGICQVSTTLHNAVLRAGILPIDRTPHSIPVSYVPIGEDATIYYDKIDYKFKNTLSYPIYIDSEVESGKLTFSVYSYNELIGKKYDIVSKVYEKIPYEVTYKRDIKLEEGEEFIEKQGAEGYKVKVYRIYFEDDKRIKEDLIYDDSYEPVSKIVRRNY